MTLRQYINELNKLTEERPETLEFDVVFSKDEEGNEYNKVYYTPTVGYFEGTRDGDFTAEEQSEYDEQSNAVCIN